MYVKPISTKQLKEIVNNMKNKKTCDVDGISNFLIKQTINQIEEPLLYIINKSLKQGIFPDDLKIARRANFQTRKQNRL